MTNKQPGFLLLESLTSFVLATLCLSTFSMSLLFLNNEKIKKDDLIYAHLAAVMLRQTNEKNCQLNGDFYQVYDHTVINLTKKITYDF